MSVYEQNGHKQGTDQVAEINKQVVFHKCLKGDLMIEQGNDHKAVTGEQLTAVANILFFSFMLSQITAATTLIVFMSFIPPTIMP